MAAEPERWMNASKETRGRVEFTMFALLSSSFISPVGSVFCVLMIHMLRLEFNISFLDIRLTKLNLKRLDMFGVQETGCGQ